MLPSFPQSSRLRSQAASSPALRPSPELGSPALQEAGGAGRASGVGLDPSEGLTSGDSSDTHSSGGRPASSAARAMGGPGGGGGTSGPQPEQDLGQCPWPHCVFIKVSV